MTLTFSGDNVANFLLSFEIATRMIIVHDRFESGILKSPEKKLATL